MCVCVVCVRVLYEYVVVCVNVCARDRAYMCRAGGVGPVGGRQLDARAPAGVHGDRHAHQPRARVSGRGAAGEGGAQPLGCRQ